MEAPEPSAGCGGQNIARAHPGGDREPRNGGAAWGRGSTRGALLPPSENRSGGTPLLVLS